MTDKKEEAQVTVVPATEASILTDTDDRKRKLEEIRAANGPLVVVAYNTDQDELLGPLQLAIDPSTGDLLGFFPRR